MMSRCVTRQRSRRLIKLWWLSRAENSSKRGAKFEISLSFVRRTLFQRFVGFSFSTKGEEEGIFRHFRRIEVDTFTRERIRNFTSLLLK